MGGWLTPRPGLLLKSYSKLCEIFRYGRAEDKESRFLRYDTVAIGKYLSTFRNSLLSPCELAKKYNQKYNIYSLNTTIYLSYKVSYMFRLIHNQYKTNYRNKGQYLQLRGSEISNLTGILLYKKYIK